MISRNCDGRSPRPAVRSHWETKSSECGGDADVERGRTPADALGQQFGKLLTTLGLKRSRLNFYALRHTFETIGGDAKDQATVDHIMGHARDDMASVYREQISDERLKAVTEYVHEWLFGSDEAG